MTLDPELVGLAVPDSDDGPFIGLVNIRDIEATEFAPTHCPGESDRKEGPVAGAGVCVGEMGHHQPAAAFMLFSTLRIRDPG